MVTAKSKVPLCRHEAKHNAQAVYKDLVKAYSDGTIASLSAESLENQLRNMKLDSHWTKPIETFLHTWSTCLYDLENVRDKDVSDADKCRWLTHSIKHHTVLYQGINTAKSVENALRAQDDFKPTGWDWFFNMVLDQAQIIDSNNASKKSTKTSNQNRSANNTNHWYRNNM